MILYLIAVIILIIWYLTDLIPEGGDENDPNKRFDR